MNPTLPLWILISGTGPMSVALDRGELSRFSRQLSLEFREVSEAPSAPGADVGESRSALDRVEAELDTARTELGALRPREAEAALAIAERLLRDHAELPQAAWLMAEHDSIDAELVQARDPELARRLKERAYALEGARALAFRERALPLEMNPSTEAELDVEGLAPRDELVWDGAARERRLRAQPGEHHVRVLRRGRLVWAGWVSFAAGSSSLRLPVPPVAPCSAEDLSETALAALGPAAAPGTACPEWAVAKVSPQGLELALCRYAECGPWRAPERAAERPLPAAKPAPSRGAPRWLTYAALAGGAVLVTSFVLVETGAFSSSGSGRERWVYEGFK